jgi:hypothetical protein
VWPSFKTACTTRTEPFRATPMFHKRRLNSVLTTILITDRHHRQSPGQLRPLFRISFRVDESNRCSWAGGLFREFQLGICEFDTEHFRQYSRSQCNLSIHELCERHKSGIDLYADTFSRRCEYTVYLCALSAHWSVHSSENTERNYQLGRWSCKLPECAMQRSAI